MHCHCLGLLFLLLVIYTCLIYMTGDQGIEFIVCEEIYQGILVMQTTVVMSYESC